MNTIDKLAIASIRVLAVDAIQKANSGHPGMALGSAPLAYTVWAKHMNFDPSDSEWINRDRFILSAGHASALQYSLLHLFGYDVSLDDLKQFRQLDSKTPGHPEFGHTHGIEATTGPLGAGLSTAVGMAMAQSHMAHKFNRADYDLLNNYTYVLAGDGCMMEGISSEASSLAGTLGLGRLIVLYDSNSITIDGSTDLAFKEDVRKRYEAYGFETFLVEDGNDIDAIDEAIIKAKLNLKQPSFIEVRTKIGYGSAKEGTSAAHGAPLGEQNVLDLKAFLNYPSMEPFYVPSEVYDHFNALTQKKQQKHQQWQSTYDDYAKAYPDLVSQWNKYQEKIKVEDLIANKALWEIENKAMSTRVISGIFLNRLSESYENLLGGSADLASSNMTNLKEQSDFSALNHAGRNLNFGVREHAMAAVGNGIMLYGGLHAYVATFFVFADFLKPMARLSSIMNVPLTYVFSHDSIGVGEDGPTHEPIEQLSMLRSMPNFYTFRPADGKETAAAWALALTSVKTPVALVLSRQNLPQLDTTGFGALQGAYIVKDSEQLDTILLASGSELELAMRAADKLDSEGIGVRVVSVPCMELFEEQSAEYKESVLPNNVRSRVAIEAGSPQSWYQYIGIDGASVTMSTYGGSAPADELFKQFGFTDENVVSVVKENLKVNS